MIKFDVLNRFSEEIQFSAEAANWRMCKRIIKRNGIPFPQFSEVIEP